MLLPGLAFLLIRIVPREISTDHSGGRSWSCFKPSVYPTDDYDGYDDVIPMELFMIDGATDNYRDERLNCGQLNDQDYQIMKYRVKSVSSQRCPVHLSGICTVTRS